MIRRVARAWSILRQDGPGGLFHSLAEAGRERLGRPSPDRLAYLAQKAAADARFDSDIGIDTGGVQHLYDLTIDSPNAAFGVNHIATDPSEFAQAIASLDIDLASATFIDFGAGKGRGLIMAAAYPFRAIIGVEFARELYQAGIDNLAKAGPHIPDPARISLQLGDATEFALPDGPLVLYFFNPFDAPVMATVARNVIAALKSAPRLMRIVYVNPVHAEVWTDLGWSVLVRERAYAILTPPA